jgi:hypothetical protein
MEHESYSVTKLQMRRLHKYREHSADVLFIGSRRASCSTGLHCSLRELSSAGDTLFNFMQAILSESFVILRPLEHL